ncbi:hypothetical protein F5Y19DRAFT_472186 [Xylariaceae sp. FL1651]|nr:hypothetical protein F5Y19DRAFT_472186 [Xylariaceae sp. FL1651]
MSTSTGSQSRRREEDSAESAYESDIDSGFDLDEASGIAIFPSGMRYSLHALDIGTREAVIKSISTPSKLALRGCSSRDQDYVFLVSESIEYHVRAGQTGSPYEIPSCSCQQDERVTGFQHPCRHTLWVCDQIASQILPHQSQPYTLHLNGYPSEEGNLCDYIPDYHFDALADGLHCDIKVGESANPSPRRIQTAREILATISETPVEQFRTDLHELEMEKRIIAKKDLEQTIFRMLLRNDSFFSYFLSSMRHYDLLNPRFRRFRDQADTALAAFDKHVMLSFEERRCSLKNFKWCVNTFKHIEQQIKSIILNSERELDDVDRRAAAHTLVYVLDRVLDHHQDHKHKDRDDEPETVINLCDALIVKSDKSYILDVLEEFPAESISHLAPELCRIQEKATNIHIPQSYINKLQRTIYRLRSSSSSPEPEPAQGSRKRSSQDYDRNTKRVK